MWVMRMSGITEGNMLYIKATETGKRVPEKIMKETKVALNQLSLLTISARSKGCARQ